MTCAACARPPRADGLLGLKMYYALAPDQRAALHGWIELLLLRGGYAGLQLVEQERAVLCMLLPAAAYRRAGRNWDALLDSLCRGSAAACTPAGRRHPVPSTATRHRRHTLWPSASRAA